MKEIPVMCYTNYPEVELFVNGKSYCKKAKDSSGLYTRYRIEWNVAYEPGEIKAIAYDSLGKAVEECVIKTAGKPYAIRFSADREEIAADGRDLSYITAEVVDKDGNVCPHASSMLYFSVEGSGELKALCNGDPTDYVPFTAPYMRVYNGKLVATIISERGKTGTITLKAVSENLKETFINIKTK